MNNNNDTDIETLSSVLTHLITKNGLTTSELARKTGVAQPVIYRLMTGTTENPQILTVKPIADYFGISIEQLFGITPFNQQKTLNNELLHEITNKLSTIKTISSVLVDTLPALIQGYQKAVSLNLINETTPLDILPLLQMNTANLLKAANSIQELLASNRIDTHQD